MLNQRTGGGGGGGDGGGDVGGASEALPPETPLVDVCNHYGKDIAAIKSNLRTMAIDVKAPVDTLGFKNMLNGGYVLMKGAGWCTL